MRRRWKQPVSVVSKSLKSLLLRRKLDDPLRSIVVAKRLEERIWSNGVASKIVFPTEISVTRAPVHDGKIVSQASVFQLVHPGTGGLLHVERVIYSSRRPILAQGRLPLCVCCGPFPSAFSSFVPCVLTVAWSR